MIPRFSNPHFLLQSTKATTRAELDAADEENSQDYLKEDSETIEQLRRLLDTSLPTWDIKSSKPRKLKENGQVEEPVLFRLVSSTLPALPISLLPSPPPPPITREPKAEDNELQADRRRKRAEAAAINVEDIPLKTEVRDSSSRKFMILKAVASVPDPESPLMIIYRQQPSRTTRPPVGSSELLHHPYVSGVSSELLALNTTSAKCTSIEAQFEVPVSSPRKGRRRRRGKETLGAKERPLPQYYRPNPRWEGKCRGYAYGYPSSFAMAEGYDPTAYWKYERDTMRKAALVE